MPILGVIASGISGHLWPANSYESIATTTVGAGGASSITFSSIPATYTHLQIRGIGISNDSGTSADYLAVQFNSDTGTNYSWHPLHGNGTSASSGGFTNYAAMYLGWVNGYGVNTAIVSPTIIDILDYANTNKYKTCRSLSGYNFNGAGADTFISFWSGNWRNSSAVSSITLYNRTGGTNFKQYSQFALYGVK